MHMGPTLQKLCISGPLTLKFDRATHAFLKFDRRHWTILKSTGFLFCLLPEDCYMSGTQHRTLRFYFQLQRVLPTCVVYHYSRLLVLIHCLNPIHQ